MSLTLYYHPLSSFCHKALIALYEREVAFDKRLINLGQEADRAALQALWPLCKFPVLRDHERQRDVPETSVIIEYLDHFFPGRPPLIPLDWEAALDARLWDRIFDNHVQGPMNQLVVDRINGSKGDMARARAGLQTAYRLVDERMASRTWVTGSDFSLADCAAAPALFYASTIESFPGELVHLSAYFERLMARPSCHRVMQEAKPFFQFYPFQERIPARFL